MGLLWGPHTALPQSGSGSLALTQHLCSPWHDSTAHPLGSEEQNCILRLYILLWSKHLENTPGCVRLYKPRPSHIQIKLSVLVTLTIKGQHMKDEVLLF